MMTFLDIKNYLAPYVEGGVCPEDERVMRTVDEAIERLTLKPGLANKLLLRHVRMVLRGSYITMPRCINRILKARIDDCTTTGVYSKWYEFLDCGPGPESMDSLDLVDLGEVCIQYDLPGDTGVYLVAFSDAEEDETARILIRGIDAAGKEVRGPNDVIGERLLMPTPPTAVKSYSLFTRVTNVIKPVTNGYITLSAIDPADGKIYQLACYAPNETTPSYRRYQINGLGYDAEDAPFTADMKALVQMRPVPITHDSDFLLVDNRAALKAMCQAIYYFNKGDAERGAAYEAIAERILMDEAMSYAHNADDQINVQLQGWATGGIPALL